ncbi:MAG TPA: hypothetical protein VF463_19400 [Sphingobium sp.]
MGAFNPIAPAVARALMDAAGIAPATIADLVKAGLVKSYSKQLKIQDASGRQERRDSRMPTDLWRRIIENGMVDDVFAIGTVRIPGSISPSPQPKVEAIGIRFDEKSIRDACVNHGAVGPSGALHTLPPAPVVEPVMPLMITTAPVDESPPAAPMQTAKRMTQGHTSSPSSRRPQRWELGRRRSTSSSNRESSSRTRRSDAPM